MARQTEFTQKVLHDLRRRKERMAMSQTPKDSNQNQTSADIYRKFKQASQGSKETNPYGSIGSTSHYVNGWYGNGQDSSFSMKESPKQITPIGGGRARSSQNIADLSMALAFGLNNNGKHKRMGSTENSISTFLHHTGKVDLVDRGSGLPSSGRFPTPSLLHIQEVSNGAEKLNQILTGCYAGLNPDKYSVEIGHELLKGAMDLEESLRMLVNLQGVSQHMIIPQRKQLTIRLVEVEEDTSHTTETVNKQTKSDRPKFSFKRPSRNSAEDVQHATKSNLIKQKQLTLYSPSEPQKISSASQAPTTSNETVSHRRSASCGEITSTITTLTNPNKHSRSDSQLQKGRLSNVIAKLMGLEEFPTTTELKAGGLNNTAIKQESSVAYNSRKPLHDTTRETEPETMRIKKLRLQTDEQTMPPTNNSETQFADRSLVRENETSERMVHKEKLHPKDPKNANVIAREQEMKTRQNKRNMKEQKNTKNGDTKKKVFEDELHMTRQICKQLEPVLGKQEKEATKETMLQKEKINAKDKLLTSTKQEKPQDSSRQPRYKLRKLELKNLKLQAAKGQMTVKKKSHLENSEETEVMQTINSSKSINDIVNLQKKLINTNPATVGKNPEKPGDAIKRSNREDLISQQHSTELNPKLKKPAKENFDHRLISTDRDTNEEISKVVITTPVSITLMQNKVEGAKSLINVPPRILKEELGSDSPDRNDMPLKQTALVLEEPEKRSHERNVAQVSIRATKEEEEANIRSPESMEATHTSPEVTQEANIRLPISREATHTISEATPALSSSAAEEYQMLKDLQIITSNDSIQKTTGVSEPLQASVVLLSEDQPFKSTDSSNQIEALQKSSIIDVPKPLQQESPKPEILGSLPANEDHLKQILLKSRVFLNAAVALFKLQIPVGTLHCSTNKYQDEDGKLLLDSGYETMRRKGKIQELTSNPCISISIGSKKVRSLDSLVKELHEDLETYTYSANEHIEDEASHLHYLLQKDIENKNPVVNCMWDFGWSDTMFSCVEKEEVVRDVEKHVFNRLIDEITRDFLHSRVAICK